MKGLDYVKKLFTCLIVLGFTFAFCSYVSADINDGLVAYYPFNGNANDESGNGNNGTVNGAVLTTDRDGNVNSAYSFDGVDDYIEVNNDPSLNPSDAITLSAWYKYSPFSGSGNNPIIDKGYLSYSDPFYQYHLGISDDSYWNGAGLIQVDLSLDQEWNFLGSDEDALDYDNWCYLVATYDGSIIKLYLNGELIGAKSASGSMTDYGQNLIIGSYSYRLTMPAYGSNYTKGIIDDIRIYNRALSENEIEQLFRGETPSCTDNDGDGYYAEDGCGTEVDCNDDDDTINPGIDRDLFGDGVDDDCDGEIDEDAPFCHVVSVTPDDFFIGFGLMPRLRIVKIIGGGVDFDNEEDIIFSSDNVLVLGSRAMSDTEISALIFITPRADTGRFDASVGDCIGKRVIDLNQWWWN